MPVLLPLGLVVAAGAVLLVPCRAVRTRPPGRGRKAPPAQLAAVRRAAFAAGGVLGAALLLGLPLWIMLLASAGASLAAWRFIRRATPLTDTELRRLAGMLDLLATGLDSGLATRPALVAVVDLLPGSDRATEALRQTTALLALGADSTVAWRGVRAQPELAALASAAERAQVGGVRLADAAREVAAELRGECRRRATRGAARAGVAITAPLALCFLPAFVCLGLAPVVVGLVSGLRLW